MTNKGNKGNWREKEDEYLKAHFSGTPSIDEIAQYLQRSKNATYRRAIFLGLTRSNPEWTQDEIEFVRQHYRGKDSLPALAKKLNRPENGIYHKVMDLGLVRSIKRSRWSPVEKHYLKDHYKKMTYEAIGKHLGRSKNAVAGMAKRLGLKKNTPR